MAAWISYCSLSALWPSQFSLPPLAYAPLKELHETDPTLDEAAGENAVFRERGFVRIPGVVGTIGFEHVRGLGAEIAELRHAQLHPRGELVAGNARGEFAVAGIPFEMARIHPLQQRSRGGVLSSGNTWRTEVPHRILGAHRRALKRRRQKTGPPVVGPVLRHATRIRNRDVRGQVLVLAPKRVRHPRAEARKTIEHEAGGEEILRRAVRVRLAGERVNEREVVRELGEMRNEITHPLASLAARAK
jgi:hypothetical protein